MIVVLCRDCGYKHYLPDNTPQCSGCGRVWPVTRAAPRHAGGNKIGQLEAVRQ